MPTDPSNGFQSVLSALMEKFLQEKHACGYTYHEPTRILRRLDDFLVQEGLATHELPRSVARKWLAKKPHESAGTQRQRITLVRHFSRFLLRLGYSAYVPDSTLAARTPSTFVPRMLTDEELRKFFPGSGRARAYGAFAFAASHYAGSFPAPVWMRVSCQRSAKTACSRRRS
jgi:site-specific recombinase XerD